MTKYEAVAQAIKTDIENGVYTEGQAIPTEELLTAQYDVSRQTIRKALALLVEDDLIIKRQGSGSVVRPKRMNPRTGKIAVVATYISDYIFPSQLRAVDEVLSENKYTAVLSATRNRVCNERAILEEILKNPVDGILIEGTKSAMPKQRRNYSALFFIREPLKTGAKSKNGQGVPDSRKDDEDGVHCTFSLT